jgi:hypothetical protein
MLVQIAWGHILFTIYLAIALLLTITYYRYCCNRPQRYPYPMVAAIRFGLIWPYGATVAHLIMLVRRIKRNWRQYRYRERNHRKWKKVLEKRRQTTIHRTQQNS